MSEEVIPVSTETPAVVPVVTEPAPAPVKTDAAPAPVVDKPAEAPKDAPPAKVVPEKYDLKLSENSPVDARFVERIAEISKSQGLSQQEAQALLVSEEQRASEAIEAQQSAWLADAQADKEIGGEKLKETAEYAKRALEGFEAQKLMTELDRFGYGNHPEVLRFLSKVGRAIADDRFVHVGVSSSGTAKKSIDQMLYGGTED